MPYIDPEVARRESARRMREMRARRAANCSERVHIPAAAPDVAVVRAVHSWLDGRRSHGIAEMIDWMSHSLWAVELGDPVKPCASHRLRQKVAP